MKNLLLFLLLLSAAGYAAENTFTNAVDTKWSTVGNWSGGSPAVDDSCVVNAATVCSLDVNVQVRALNIIGGSFKTNKKILQVDSNFIWGSSGTFTIDFTFTLYKNATINNYGTIFPAGCHIYHRGSGKILLYKNFACNGYSTAYPGTQDSLIILGACSFSIVGGANSFVLNGGSYYDYANTNSAAFYYTWTSTSQFFNQNATTLISLGYAARNFYTATSGIKLTVPKMIIEGAGTLDYNFRNQQGATNDTIDQTDSVIIKNASLNIVNYGGGTGYVYLSNGHYISCGRLMIGNTSVSSASTWRFSKSNLSIGSFAQLLFGYGTRNIYLDTSFWDVSGSWTWAAGNNLDVGTSVVRFIGGQNVVVSTSNHTSAFYTLIDSVNTGYKLSLGDSLTCTNLSLTSGNFASLTYNSHIAKRLSITSPDSANFGTGRHTFDSTATIYKRSTGALITGGASFVAPNGLAIDVDSNMTVYNVKIDDGKKLTLTSGRILNDSTYTTGDLEGTAAAYDTIISGTAGQRATLTIPDAVDTLRYVRVQDIAFTNAVVCSSCINGGNVLNATFIASTSDTTPPVTGPTITKQPSAITANDGATARDTITATGTGTLSYTWTMSGDTVGAGQYLSFTASYALHNGKYLKCAVADDNGTTVSDSVLVTVVYDTLKSLTYDTVPICSTGTRFIYSFLPTYSGVADSFTIDTFPSGLSFTKITGKISGSPTDSVTSLSCKVIGWGPYNNDTTTIEISCYIGPPYIAYNKTTLKTYKNKTFTLTPINTGGLIDSFTVNKPWPDTILMVKSTGVIHGADTSSIKARDTLYISAYNISGTDTFRMIYLHAKTAVGGFFFFNW